MNSMRRQLTTRVIEENIICVGTMIKDSQLTYSDILSELNVNFPSIPTILHTHLISRYLTFSQKIKKKDKNGMHEWFESVDCHPYSDIFTYDETDSRQTFESTLTTLPLWKLRKAKSFWNENGGFFHFNQHSCGYHCTWNLTCFRVIYTTICLTWVIEKLQKSCFCATTDYSHKAITTVTFLENTPVQLPTHPAYIIHLAS